MRTLIIKLTTPVQWLVSQMKERFAFVTAKPFLFTVSGGLLVSVLLVGAWAALTFGYYANHIYPRVSVKGVAVGNLTEKQAVTKLLASTIGDVTRQPLVFTTEERDWEIAPETIALAFDATQSAQRAYQFGKDDRLLKIVRSQWQLITSGKQLSPKFSYDQAKFDEKLAEITKSVEIPAQSSTINYVDGQLIVAPSVAGKAVDRELLSARIASYLAGIDTGKIVVPLKVSQPAVKAEDAQKLLGLLETYVNQPIELSYENKKMTVDINGLLGMIDFDKSTPQTIAIAQEKLDKYIASYAILIDRPAKDALFQFTGGKVAAFQASQDGLIVDRAALADAIEQTFLTGGQSRAVTVPVKRTPAKVVTESVNNLGIKELIAHGESNYRNSPADRVFNIELAVSRINGVLIPPGKEFSFNDAIGEISAATGYKQALIILSGRTVLGDGGGVCQVSTTVFRSALESGLPITARTAHSFRINYYENDRGPGFDATIYQPGVDFKFKNDTGKHILLQAWVDRAASKINIDLYGTSDGRQTTVSKTAYLSTTPVPPDQYIDDPNLLIGTIKQVEKPAPGAKVSFTRTVIRNGETIIQETFNSNYTPWRAVFLRGTKEGV